MFKDRHKYDNGALSSPFRHGLGSAIWNRGATPFGVQPFLQAAVEAAQSCHSISL